MSKKTHRKPTRTPAVRAVCPGCGEYTVSTGYCTLCLILLRSAGGDAIKQQCIVYALHAARQFGLTGADVRGMAQDAITRFEAEVLKRPGGQRKLVD
jgi:hypothetical protein